MRNDKPEKYLFLDIDGVLNQLPFSRKIEKILDEKCVMQLKRIIDTTQCAIILSSSWKMGWIDMENGIVTSDIDSFLFLKESLEEYGIWLFSHTPIGKTRGEEISEWLRFNKVDLQNIVILDDYDIPQFTGRQIKVDRRYGLTKNKASTAIKMLQSASEDHQHSR